MNANNNEGQSDLQNDNKPKPTGYKVEDDGNLEEKDLERSFLFGGEEEDKAKPGKEGEGMGGHNFGKISETTAGADNANPSQNAGNTNDYFKRTEPSEEHPENGNFTKKEQDGEADYNQAQPFSKQDANSAKPGSADSNTINVDSETPHVREPYQPGTADEDN